MIEPVVTFSPPRLGYCGNCGRPAPVTNLKLRGWEHATTICELCLMAVARAIVMAPPSSSEEP